VNFAPEESPGKLDSLGRNFDALEIGVVELDELLQPLFLFLAEVNLGALAQKLKGEKREESGRSAPANE